MRTQKKSLFEIVLRVIAKFSPARKISLVKVVRSFCLQENNSKKPCPLTTFNVPLRTISLGIFLAFVIACGSAVSASEMTRSYEQLSPNGKYIFVMLSTAERTGVTDKLRDQYGHSGLYKPNDFTQSLWRVDWYSPRVHVSNDGQHLVRIGSPVVEKAHGSPDMSQLAVAFYNKGKLLKRYNVSDLIKDHKRLTKSGQGYEWQTRIAFDDASGRLDVTLSTGSILNFDIKSGKLAANQQAPKKKK